MKHRGLLYLFGIDLLAELIAIQYGLSDLRLATKPLLMILLVLFVLLQTYADNKIRILLLLAICFSLSGDVFLLFEQSSSANFMLGLVSFLVAHICYIWLFARIKINRSPKRKWNPWIITAVLLYVFLLIYILSPYLGALKIPVIVYASVLGGMLTMALHAFDFNGLPAGRWIIAGAALFVLSDSLLAFNKFYSPFEFAGLGIMLSYALAQLFIVTGVTKFMGSADKP